MSRIRFGAWSGTQDPFPVELSPEELLDALSDDLLDGRDPQAAIDDLVRRGMSGRLAGLEELRQRLAAARRAEVERMGLEAPLQQVAQRLEEILELERTALQFADDQAAADQRRGELDALPPDVAGRIAGLQAYEWQDRGAEADFERLLADLRRDVAEATFGRLAGALRNADPEQLARLRDLLADLNAMAARQERGEDVSDDFAAFKQRYGDLLPGDPQTLDELLEELARRMAAMSSLVAGLSPEQRSQLAGLAEQALGDLDLRFQADQLTRALQQRFPGMGWDATPRGASPSGLESGSLSDTVDWVQRLQSFDDLGTQLGQRYPGARVEDVDAEALRDALGEDAARDLDALRRIERLLEEAGAVRREGGRLELTARGVRALGERSLARIYADAVTGPAGSHRALTIGGDQELTGSTRPLRFGDPFRLDVPRTLGNAVVRGGLRRDAAGVRVQLASEDFELAEADRRVRTTTVLLLDMSFSMPLRGNWDAAKRLALALQSLVASKFPQDRFHVVGFSDFARRLQPRDLLVSGWERVWGTNMEHAFRIARRLLTADPGTERRTLMVTDGEPTAHLEGARSAFSWPPDPLTLRKTLAEAGRLARTGTTLDVFLLDHDPGAARFVESMVHRVGGRILYPDLHDLGRLVVRDYLRRRA